MNKNNIITGILIILSIFIAFYQYKKYNIAPKITFPNLSLTDLDKDSDYIAIFGNEARGIDALLDSDVVQVCIPMKGSAESLNLSAAASIVMFTLS
jgi:tRNA G18 (ribose-2'-O)-methylase SpoU